MKKIISAFIISAILLSLVGCGGESSAEISLKKGDIPPLSDKAFTLNLKTDEGAPKLSQVNVKAKANDSVMVAGKGFLDEDLKVYVCDMANGKTKPAKYTAVDDNLMSVTVDKSFKNSIFSLYAENSLGFGNSKLINAPKIWDINFKKVTAGEEFCIYGENFVVSDNKKPVVYLVSEEGYCEPELLYTDPHKITVKTPNNLKDGESYIIYVYNGVCGKYGVCEAKNKITYSDTSAVVFEGNTIYATDFGADAKSVDNDDTEFIKAAIESAEDGDTIYFPKGYYLINEDIQINKSLKFVGEGAKNSILLAGNGLEKTLFSVTSTPLEVTKLGFEQKRTKGKIKNTFFTINGDGYDNGTWSVYIHDCSFIQNGSKKYISRVFAMDISSCNGVRIEDNKLDTFGFLTGRDLKNTLINNNEFDSNFITGYYYGQDSFSISSAETIDISDNIIEGKGAKDENPFSYGDYTAGRCIVFNVVTNAYIGNNTLRKAGIPHCNAGEMFLLENLNVKYDGALASADDSSVTLPENSAMQFSKGDIISFVSGEGLYQYRTVVSAKGKTANLDTPLDVIPNTDSRVIISHCFSNIALYNNLFSGYSTWAEYPGATTSLQAYGSVHNLFMEKNTFKDLPEGICITPYYFNPAENSGKAVISWCVFDNNIFDSNGVGVRYMPTVDPNEGTVPACVSFGVLLRRNSFKNISEYKHTDEIGEGGYAIQMGAVKKKAVGGRWIGDWVNGILIENNTFKRSEIADISLGNHQNHTLVRGNKGKIKYKIHENADKAVEIKY